MKTPEEIMALTPSERRFLVFLDDDLFDQQANSTSPSTGKIAAKVGVGVLTGGLGLLLWQAIESALDSGLNIRPVKKSWIAGHLHLPPGHPVDRVVYACHPIKPKVYIPISDYHRYTFEDMFNEVVSLLTHLGAKRITVKNVHGWGREFSTRLKTVIPGESVGAEAEAGGHASEQSTVLFDAKLTGHDNPQLPADLAWYHTEQTWQSIHEVRSKNWLKEFRLSLTNHSDYGINAGLALRIQGAGFEVGGAFEEHRSTQWEISGVFPDNKKAEPIAAPDPARK